VVEDSPADFRLVDLFLQSGIDSTHSWSFLASAFEFHGEYQGFRFYIVSPWTLLVIDLYQHLVL
jgi:hypothetical protein